MAHSIGFSKYLDQRGIKRLEYIFQTHPDYDHFHGMRELLEHFTKDGRSVGCWCDGGINAPHVRDIVWKEDISPTRYAKLQECLNSLYAQNLIDIRELSDDVKPFGPKKYPGIRLIPIAPTAGDKRTITREGLSSLAANTAAKLETNALSVVLVLAVKDSDAELNILLSGDADPDKLKAALNTWREFASDDQRESGFNSVKVSHHGSANSHLGELCVSGRGISKLAAVSAGERQGLPASTVLKEWQDSGWIVLATTTRHQPKRINRPVELVNRKPKPSPTIRSNDICIKWSPSEGISWGPDTAQIHSADLAAYQ